MSIGKFGLNQETSPGGEQYYLLFEKHLTRLNSTRRNSMSDIDLMIEDDEDLEQQADKFLMFKLGSEEYGVPRQAWLPPSAKQSYPNLTKGITAG
jgi:hypothetical protein